MSVQNEVYSALVSVLNATFPDKRELPNPYDVILNPSLFLADGYGVAISTALPTNRFATCELRAFARNYVVILTKQIHCKENDLENLRAIENSLYVDQFSMINASKTVG